MKGTEAMHRGDLRRQGSLILGRWTSSSEFNLAPNLLLKNNLVMAVGVLEVLGWGKILGLPANGDKISGSGVTGKGFGNGRDQVRTPHQVLTGGNYLQEVLNILDTLAGEKQETEMRRTVQKALFEGTRKAEESISQFAFGREQEFSMAERYMTIPEELKGIMLEEHAGLGKQGAMSLRTLTGGATDYALVSRALKVLDSWRRRASW